MLGCRASEVSLNNPNTQIEQILATLAATNEQVKALEARLDRLERPLPALQGLPELPGLSDEERETSERNRADDWAELMEQVAKHRLERSKPGYAERKAERKRQLREWGYDV